MPVMIVLLIIFGLASQTAAAADSSWTRALPVVERDPQAVELLAYPTDGKAMAFNPPGFTWTPNDQAKSYRLEVRNQRQSTQTVISAGPLTSTVYPVPRTLAPGAYAWQVVYLDSSGNAMGVSKTRNFTVRAGLPQLPMPDVAQLKAKLVAIRPRLFLAGTRLREIQEAVRSGRVQAWQDFISRADRALDEKPYPEPPPYPNGKFNADDWRRIYMPGKTGSAHVARTALAYRITGDKKYLEGARRWMLNIASWDPKGITSHRLRLPDGSEGDDEASMPILERMSFGWDWIGDQLTPQEREKVLAAITERGNQVFRLLQKQDFLSHPFSNHEGRVLAFLGEAGLSFLGDIPDAEKWLDYVLRCYLTSYPGWGGDEGGWAQGTSYWSAYMYWLTMFAEALRGVTDVDIFRRPFYRNTGYLAVYNHPPYAPRGGFGDGAYGPPSEAERMLIENLANAFRDPVLAWQVQSITSTTQAPDRAEWLQWLIEDVVSILRTPKEPGGLAPQPPTKLDGSRFFTDIGWVAMHSALGDAKEDVWALFKSSRYGSFSHSHADQNTFHLDAYGQALLIDSGYYPWYGSPHDELWTRQTKAHNGILVNGRGQPPFTWAANGTIENYIRQGIVTIARGQASKAYNLPQTDEVKGLWREWLKEPIPPMEPKVESFERTVAFVASKKRPIFVVQDHLRADAPTTFDWLLHALTEMKFDDEAGSVFVQNGDARVAIRLIATEPFRFSQRDWFAVPPELDEATARTASDEERKKKFANQWHLNAHTGKPVQEIKFLAVMVPYRASEPAPEIRAIRSADARGFRVGDTEVAAWCGAGNHGKITVEDLKGEGRLIVRVTDQGKTQTVVSE